MGTLPGPWHLVSRNALSCVFLFCLFVCLIVTFVMTNTVTNNLQGTFNVDGKMVRILHFQMILMPVDNNLMPSSHDTTSCFCAFELFWGSHYLTRYDRGVTHQIFEDFWPGGIPNELDTHLHQAFFHGLGPASACDFLIMLKRCHMMKLPVPKSMDYLQCIGARLSG